MMTSYAQGHELLITDPQIIAIPIQENHEPMVDLKGQQAIVLGPSPEIPNNTDYTKMRKTVYKKLVQAQKLLPEGFHFCLYEGYRSLSTQKLIFENRYAKVKKLYPTWPDDKIFIETTRLVSPIVHLDGTKNIPPHSTGGAIDVYLLDDKGHAIDMGIHPKDWIDDNTGVSLTAATSISAAAQQNRKIMSAALSAAGFVNYTQEYWHWSYGDRYWAHQKGKKSAIYNSY
ncbi:MAG: M15 family metallopeptidase [Pseudomonadota bacterium]